MKRTAIAAVFLLLAAGAAADEKREKRMLIGELMKVMDAPDFHRSVCAKMTGGEDRAPLLARIDFRAVADAADADIFDQAFTSDELRQVIAFLKTTTGQKTLGALAAVIGASMPVMQALAAEAAQAIEEEKAKERLAKYPWLKTMEDMRVIATAAEAYATDNNRYPAAASMEELRAFLEPTYVRTLPMKDSWGNAFVWRISPDGQHYRILSAGADGRLSFDSEVIDVNAQPKQSDSLDEDIVYQDGTFLRFPKEASPDVPPPPPPS